MVVTWEAVVGMSILLAIAGALNALVLQRALTNFEERLIAKLDQRYVLVGMCQLSEQKINFEIERLREGIQNLKEERDEGSG